MLDIRRVENEEFRKLFAHMKRDFPASELPPYAPVRRNLSRGIWRALLFSENGTDVGYAVITAPQGLDYALINYFAVLPEHRSSGYGSELIRLISENIDGRTAVIEVEDPEFAKTEAHQITCERRIAFYERAGFCEIPTSRARIFGVPMRIMAMTDSYTGNIRELMHAFYLPGFPTRKLLRFIDVQAP